VKSWHELCCLDSLALSAVRRQAPDGALIRRCYLPQQTAPRHWLRSHLSGPNTSPLTLGRAAARSSGGSYERRAPLARTRVVCERLFREGSSASGVRMTTNDEQFQTLASQTMVYSIERARTLRTLADEFRQQDRHLAAAQASLEGHHAAWGQEPHQVSTDLLFDGVNDLLRHLRDAPDSWTTLLALSLLVQSALSPLWGGNAALRQVGEAARVDYEALLRRLADGHPHTEALLISGFELVGHLDRDWRPLFPEREVDAGYISVARGDGRTTHGMESAFKSLLRLADYDGAARIADENAHALITPALRGWALGTHALVTPSPDLFAAAAAEFLADSPDRPGRRERGWTSINQQLWGPYFQSRGYLSRGFETPADALTLLRSAFSSISSAGGWLVAEPVRYFAIIRGLIGMADSDSEAIRSATEDLVLARHFTSQSPVDHHIHEFLRSASATLAAGVSGEWLRELAQLMLLLDRLPILSPSEKGALASALNVIIPDAVWGDRAGWEYDALASVDDERQLHRILLGLFRAEAKTPIFADIRHGPIEYGKDLVVCRDEGGRRVLKMYSAKKGPVRKANWNREIRPQLEEIFQVEFSSTELPVPIDERVGVLVWNDHIHPYAQPIIDGWIRDQQEVFGRRYELMHIDALVAYVRANGLQGALRAGLRREGLLA